jgi:limonene-1,2-epoxide hydrolase
VIGRREVIIMAAGATLAACSKNMTTSGESDMSSRFEQFKAVIESWKKKDIDAVINALSDDVVWHYAAAIAPPAKGKAEARAFIERFGAGIGEVKWRIFEYAETADRLFVEGVDEYVTKDGVSVAAPYAGVIEFSGDKISGWRDYVDRGVIDHMKAGNPYPEQVKELIARSAR